MGLQAKSVITTSFTRDDRGYFFLGAEQSLFHNELVEKKNWSCGLIVQVRVVPERTD